MYIYSNYLVQSTKHSHRKRNGDISQFRRKAVERLETARYRVDSEDVEVEATSSPSRCRDREKGPEDQEHGSWFRRLVNAI